MENTIENTQTINLDDKLITIKSNKCFFCGKPKTNKHHVIPKAFKSKQNIEIPLCDEHKDVLHVTVKTFYFPKELRNKLGKIKKLTDNLNVSVASMRKELDFSKHKKNTIFNRFVWNY